MSEKERRNNIEDEEEKEITSISGEEANNMKHVEEEIEKQKTEDIKGESPANRNASLKDDELEEEGNQQLEEDSKKDIEALEKEKEELMDRLLRLQADFDNYRKRMKGEKEELVKHANFELIKKILPVIDNMERALASAEKGTDGVIEGLEMIMRQFKEVMESEGVTPIESVGKTFDPALHEAVLTEENEEHPPGTVIEELQKGYVMQERVLRPSMVKVSVEKKEDS